MADNTIALQAKAPVIDPLATITSLNQAQQGLLQNRLLGQQIQGKEALGRSITGAYDPATGKVDFDKALGTLAQDPQGAFAAPEFSAQVIARHLAETQATGAKLELGLKQAKAITDTTAPLLAEKAPLTRDVVIRTMQDRLLKSGLFNDPDSVKLFETFVQTLPDDDQGIRSLLQRAGESANMTTEGINLYRGTPTNVDVGGHIVNQRVSPLTGEMQINGAIDKTFAPALVDVYNPVTRTMEKRTAADVAAASGGGGAPATGGAPNGRYPGAGGGAPFAAGPAMGEAEATAKTAGASGEGLAALRARTGEAGARLFQLDEALKAIESAPTGKGSSKIQDWRSILDTIGVPIGPEEEGKMIAFDKARKYMLADLAQRGSALGLNTDQARATLGGASPSVEISKMAAQDLLKVAKGLTRMELAQEAAFAASGIPESGFARWASEWNRSVDPRAFMGDQIPEAQRRAMISKMSPEERQRFANGLIAAKAAKLW